MLSTVNVKVQSLVQRLQVQECLSATCVSVPVQGSATSLESIESASQEESKWKVSKEVQEGSKLLSLQLLWKLLGRIVLIFVHNFYYIF